MAEVYLNGAVVLKDHRARYVSRLLLVALCVGLNFGVAAGQGLASTSTSLEVSYRSGKLYVKANRAPLSILLQTLAHRLQVALPPIDPSLANRHVNGDFGPADPHDVLARILSQTGADYLIVSRGSQMGVAEFLVFKRAAPSPHSPSPELQSPSEPDLAADRERIADDLSPEDMAGPGLEIDDRDLEAVEPRRKVEEESPEPQ